MTTWTVPAEIMSVVDGDTLKLNLDLGWHIKLMEINVRVYGMDAPEMSTNEGIDARRYAITLLAKPNIAPVTFVPVTFVSHSLDKYGRPLGAVTLPDGRDFAQLMIAAGHAVPYFGGTRA